MACCNKMGKGYEYGEEVVCKKCYKSAVLYFDFTYDYYWYLKMLFNKDIAQYTTTHYYHIKLKL